MASELRYYIIAGDPNEDFHLDQLTGSLSVSRSLDFERVQEYSLTVQVCTCNSAMAGSWQLEGLRLADYLNISYLNIDHILLAKSMLSQDRKVELV